MWFTTFCIFCFLWPFVSHFGPPYGKKIHKITINNIICQKKTILWFTKLLSGDWKRGKSLQVSWGILPVLECASAVIKIHWSYKQIRDWSKTKGFSQDKKAAEKKALMCRLLCLKAIIVLSIPQVEGCEVGIYWKHFKHLWLQSEIVKLYGSCSEQGSLCVCQTYHALCMPAE